MAENNQTGQQRGQQQQPQPQPGGMLIPTPIDTSSAHSKIRSATTAPIFLPTPETRAGKEGVLVRKPYGSEPIEVDPKNGKPTKTLQDVWEEQREEVKKNHEKAVKENEQAVKEFQKQREDKRSQRKKSKK